MRLVAGAVPVLDANETARVEQLEARGDEKAADAVLRVDLVQEDASAPRPDEVE